MKYVVMYKTESGHEYYKGEPREGDRCWTAELSEARQFDDGTNLLTAFSGDRANRNNYINDPTKFFFVPVP